MLDIGRKYRLKPSDYFRMKYDATEIIVRVEAKDDAVWTHGWWNSMEDPLCSRYALRYSVLYHPPDSSMYIVTVESPPYGITELVNEQEIENQVL